MKNSCAHASIPNWIMRIVLSVVFLTAAYNKLFIFGIDGFAAGTNLPVFIAWLVALGELGAGIGIIIGGLIKNIDKKSMLTMASGLVIVIIMLGAIFLAKWGGFEGGFIAGIKGMYTDLALLALGLNFAMMGNAQEEKCVLCANK